MPRSLEYFTPAKANLRYDKPDWQTIDRQINCPLCRYNLRGLVDPRCPECGYAFFWADFLDPARQKHPYLFEFRPESNFKSFWKTAFHGLRPMKFWATLRADQPCVRRRLMWYWLIVALVFVLHVACNIGLVVLDDNVQRWGTPMSAIGGPISMGTPVYPVAFQWPSYFDYTPLIVPVSAILLWPFLTFVSLNSLRVSMRRAKIGRLHVLRCAIYSWDVVLWIAMAAMAINFVEAAFILWAHFNSPSITTSDWRVMIPPAGAFLLLPVFVYRVIVAYRKYLRFQHAISVVLLTQFIVFLAVLSVATYSIWALE